MLMRHCACGRVVLSSKLDIQPIPIIKTTPAILYIAFSNCCLLHVEGYVGQVVGHGNRICSVYRYGVAFRGQPPLLPQALRHAKAPNDNATAASTTGKPGNFRRRLRTG
jgi:hypothetical protein